MSAVSAQESSPISAERPGFSSSPVTLGKSLFQIEGGYQFTADNGPVDSEDHTLPFALLRYGLTENAEIQLSWSGHSWSDIGGQHFDGTNDAGIGVKWRLSGSDSMVPIALFAGLSVPIGDSSLGDDDVEPTVGAFWSYSSELDWFGTVLVSESNNDTSVDNAVGISFSIGADKSGYVEYFGNYGHRSGPEHNLNGGISFLPERHIQIDVNGGLGLNSRAPDFFLGFGVAYRF